MRTERAKRTAPRRQRNVGVKGRRNARASSPQIRKAKNSAACRYTVGGRLKLCPCLLFCRQCGGVVLFCAFAQAQARAKQRICCRWEWMTAFAATFVQSGNGRGFQFNAPSCAISTSEVLPNEEKTHPMQSGNLRPRGAAVIPRFPPPRTPSSGTGRCNSSRPARSAPACPRRSPCRPRRRPQAPCR